MRAWERGARVVVRDEQGAVLVCRVWEDRGRSVLLCTEAEFRPVCRTGEPLLAVPFARRVLV
jgi:hypothetical protein